MSQSLDHLPVFEHLDKIGRTVMESKVTLLTATPGSGKTLLVPPYIVKNSELRVAMLQPRRVAAQLSALSIAQFNNWKLGQEVGLIMKNVRQMSSQTRLSIMTEGVLSRMLASGDVKNKFDLIILDEFHERSMHTDLACAWLKKQKDIKLLIMSATLDTKPILNFFPETKTVHIEGRVHGIENHHLKQSLNFHDRHAFHQKLSEVCEHALSQSHEGNILVFLPGSGDIHRAAENLRDQEIPNRHKVDIHLLYSRAKKEDQAKALANDSKRKIILSTNIAETSLTIPNVKIVVDSGLQKESSYNPKSGVQSLATRRVALDSAIQRAGRAGRLSAGVCFKLWTKADEQRFRKTTPAEIHRIDPIEFMLKVLSFGEDLSQFDFFEKPKEDQSSLAIKRLEISGCLKNKKLTPLGKWVSQFPGDFSSALLAAVSLDKPFLKQSLLSIVILQEGDPASFLSNSRDHEPEDDLRSRLSWLKENPKHHYHSLAKKLKEQIFKISEDVPLEKPIESLEEALCFSFVHRLCRFRNSKKKNALMSTGRGVKIGKRCAPIKSDFFIALDLIDHQLHGQMESEVSFTFSLNKKTIKKIFEDSILTTTIVETTKKKETPKANVYQSFWEMPLEAPRGLPLEKKHMLSHLKKIIHEEKARVFKEMPEVIEFLDRVAFCREHSSDFSWPSFSQEDWNLILETAYSETEELHLSLDNWMGAIKMLFTEGQLDFLESFAPQFFATKTRRTNRIIYEDPNKPKVSIILQEAFEIKSSPSVGSSGVTLGIELLAPSRRPIEVSFDMGQFWQTSYPEVRKQYRGRYPKHSWPETIE